MKSNWEIRSIPSDDAEVRAVGDDRSIEGYGIVFNKESRDLGGFTEVILPEAIEGVVDRSDVLALMNHDINKGVLARCTNGKGSMELRADDKGVKYSFKAPKFNLGNELLEGVERGDIRASSFAFTVPIGGDRWEKQEDGHYKRTVMQFDEIYDMSPCYRAAYVDTTVARRSIEELQKIDNPEAIVVKPEVGEEPAPEPITRMEDVEASNLELQFRIYKQKQQLKDYDTT
jgi:HK97 family phage prohead protease